MSPASPWSTSCTRSKKASACDCSSTSRATRRAWRVWWRSSPAPTGTSARFSTCSASASRATRICAGCSCRRIGKGIRCARITRWAMKRSNSLSTSTRSTGRSPMPKSDSGRRIRGMPPEASVTESGTTLEATPFDDPRLAEYRHLVSERALSGETVILNMGPQHPSTHGVLRLILELDGERVITCIPDIGFLHTGVEKNMESKTYIKALVMTDRLDYMNNVGNNLAYALAVEKLVGLDVPPRAQAIRVILAELQRISSHLVWLGTHALDLAAMSLYLDFFREREIILDILEMVSGQRMMTSYIRPGGLWRDVPPEFEPAVREFIKIFPHRLQQ